MCRLIIFVGPLYVQVLLRILDGIQMNTHLIYEIPRKFIVYRAHKHQNLCAKFSKKKITINL